MAGSGFFTVPDSSSSVGKSRTFLFPSNPPSPTIRYMSTSGVSQGSYILENVSSFNYTPPTSTQVGDTIVLFYNTNNGNLISNVAALGWSASVSYNNTTDVYPTFTSKYMATTADTTRVDNFTLSGTPVRTQVFTAVISGPSAELSALTTNLASSSLQTGSSTGTLNIGAAVGGGLHIVTYIDYSSTQVLTQNGYTTNAYTTVDPGWTGVLSYAPGLTTTSNWMMGHKPSGPVYYRVTKTVNTNYSAFDIHATYGQPILTSTISLVALPQQLLASTPKNTNMIEVALLEIGQRNIIRDIKLEIYVGASGSEQLIGVIPYTERGINGYGSYSTLGQGLQTIMTKIPAGSRISIRILDSNANTYNIYMALVE